MRRKSAIDSTGKIRITGKDELHMPESLGRSQDRADSLRLSVAKQPEEQAAFVVVAESDVMCDGRPGPNQPLHPRQVPLSPSRFSTSLFACIYQERKRQYW